MKGSKVMSIIYFWSIIFPRLFLYIVFISIYIYSFICKNRTSKYCIFFHVLAVTKNKMVTKITVNRHLHYLDIYFPWWQKSYDMQICSVETLKYNISLFCIIIHLYIIRWLNQWIMWRFNVMWHFTRTYHVTI